MLSSIYPLLWPTKKKAHCNTFSYSNDSGLLNRNCGLKVLCCCITSNALPWKGRPWDTRGTYQGIQPCKGGPGSSSHHLTLRNWDSRNEEVVKQRGKEKGKEKLCSGKENYIYKGLKRRTDSTFQGTEEPNDKEGRKSHGEAGPVVLWAVAGVWSLHGEQWETTEDLK